MEIDLGGVKARGLDWRRADFLTAAIVLNNTKMKKNAFSEEGSEVDRSAQAKDRRHIPRCLLFGTPGFLGVRLLCETQPAIRETRLLFGQILGSTRPAKYSQLRDDNLSPAFCRLPSILGSIPVFSSRSVCTRLLVAMISLFARNESFDPAMLTHRHRRPLWPTMETSPSLSHGERGRDQERFRIEEAAPLLLYEVWYNLACFNNNNNNNYYYYYFFRDKQEKRIL